MTAERTRAYAAAMRVQIELAGERRCLFSCSCSAHDFLLTRSSYTRRRSARNSALHQSTMQRDHATSSTPGVAADARAQRAAASDAATHRPPKAPKA